MKHSSITVQIFFGILLGSALAQDARITISPRDTRGHPAASPQGSARIRVDSDLVLVPVLVTDIDDRLVTGLDKSHFKVFEDDVPQEISTFASEDAPVSIALLFDTSGSMGEKLKKSRMAVNEFLGESNPDDEFALIEFNDRARLLVPFTSRPEDIQDQMIFLASQGRTALFDAVSLALNEMKHARHSRKAILIVSDGGDNASRFSEREVRKRVKEADVQIYSIGILESMSRRWGTPEEERGPRLLQDIASHTGGRLVEVVTANGLPEIAAKIGMALRNQYVLGYSPSMPRRDGKFHRITVKLEPPVGSPKLRASFRTSYLAPEH